MRFIVFFTFLLIAIQGHADDAFAMITNENLWVRSGDTHHRHSPCSTFKIAISLMGYNEGLLEDERNPELPFVEGYMDFLEVWRQPHNPQTWMRNSCVWYSQLITNEIGRPKFEEYLQLFNYGNKNASGNFVIEDCITQCFLNSELEISAEEEAKLFKTPSIGAHYSTLYSDIGLTHCWLGSSLKISAEEQALFIKKLLDGSLPVSAEAHEFTKRILYIEDFAGGKLYGKTGSGYAKNRDGSPNRDCPIGWFVGWFEKDGGRVIFAKFINPEPGCEYAGREAREMVKVFLPLIKVR